MAGDNHILSDDDCPLCKVAEPTDLGRLFDAVDASLTGCKLSKYQNLGKLTIEAAELDLRKLLALLMRQDFYTRRDGCEEKTPVLPKR